MMPKPGTDQGDESGARLTFAASSFCEAVGGCQVIFCLPRRSVPPADTSELGVAASADPACHRHSWHLGFMQQLEIATFSVHTVCDYQICQSSSIFAAVQMNANQVRPFCEEANHDV